MSETWIAVPAEDGEITEITTQSRVDDNRVPIATVETGFIGYIGTEQERAVPLIASAPDMLEALNKVMGLCLSEDQDPDTLSEDVFGIVSRAIAKATGEPS